LQNEKLAKNKWISLKIFSQINICVEKGEQVLLFLNRRGYSPLSLCAECGYRYQCDHCSSWLVMHRNKKRLLCHHCGTIYPVDPVCPKCSKKNSLKLIGPGVERLAEEIKDFFPKYNIGIMSSDNANTPKKIKKIVDDFSSNKINILVATQIMAKGYHFPNLSLVGIIDADAGLMGGDIKAIERTYNLLQQVSGRAGRAKQSGKVLIQTYFPNQPVIQSLKNRDRKKFVEQSLLEREQFNVPPFSFLTAIIISGSSKARAESYAINLAKAYTLNDKINILGPVEAPLFLLRGQYRFRLLLKAKSRRKLNNFTRNLIKNCPTPLNLRLIVDVDPYTFI
jgi:primosomal protein N' (replication factor Y)